MSDFDSKIFAIKLINNKIIIVNESDNYNADIVVKDKMTSCVNGNKCYAAFFMDKNGKESPLKINGWTIRKLEFPGDWFNNCIDFDVVDCYSFEKNIRTDNNRQIYPDHRETMIRKAMEEVLNVCKTPFQKYNQFMEGLNIKDELSIRDANELINNKIQKYIETYNSVLELLAIMHDSDELVCKVKESFSENLAKLSKVKIVESEVNNG